MRSRSGRRKMGTTAITIQPKVVPLNPNQTREPLEEPYLWPKSFQTEQSIMNARYLRDVLTNSNQTTNIMIIL